MTCRVDAGPLGWATLAGSIPASLLPARSGNESVSGEPKRAAWAATGSDVLTLTPFVVAALWERLGKRVAHD